MSKGVAIDLGLSEAYNDLFSTQEERDNARRSYVTDLPAAEISDFPDHPFKVRMDEEMERLVDSVKERGTHAVSRDGRTYILPGEAQQTTQEPKPKWHDGRER